MIPVYFYIGIALFIGLVLGLFIGSRVNKDHSTPVGSFIINYNDPEKDLLCMKLDEDLPVIESSKYISLRVVVEDTPSSNSEISPE